MVERMCCLLYLDVMLEPLVMESYLNYPKFLLSGITCTRNHQQRSGKLWDLTVFL